MTLTLNAILHSADIDPSEALVTRHAYVREPEKSGLQGIHADSTDDEILEYTSRQSTSLRRFPGSPPRFWIVFTGERDADEAHRRIRQTSSLRAATRSSS